MNSKCFVEVKSVKKYYVFDLNVFDLIGDMFNVIGFFVESGNNYVDELFLIDLYGYMVLWFDKVVEGLKLFGLELLFIDILIGNVRMIEQEQGQELFIYDNVFKLFCEKFFFLRNYLM